MFKGHLVSTKESVTIKVPRVPDYIRKEKKEVKIHMEEAKKLMATPFRKPRHENLVRYLNVAYDDFRKEIWVVGFIFAESFHNYLILVCSAHRFEIMSTDPILKH